MWVIICSHLAYALVPWPLYGTVDQLFKPEAQHLSPVYGALLCRSQVLENLRFLLPEHTSTARVIERFFPSKNGTHLAVNQNVMDPISHLSAEVLGHMVRLLVEKKNGSAMQDLLYDALVASDVRFDEKRKIQKRLDALVARQASCTHVCQQKRERDLRLYPELLRRLYELKTPVAVMKNDVLFSAAHLRPFLNDIVAAEGEFYDLVGDWFLPHLVMAYFSAKYSTLNDIRAFLKPLSQHLSEEGLRFVQGDDSSYGSVPPDVLYRHAEPLMGKNASSFMSGVGRAFSIISYYDTYLNPFPALLPFQMSTVNVRGRKVTFADCSETVLRNFFSILLYDSEKMQFDVDRLERHNDVHTHPALKAYFKKYANPIDLLDGSARNVWAQDVISFHKLKGVYVKDGFELEADMKSFLHMVLALLDTDHTYDDRSVQEQWDLIVYLLGPGLTWAPWSTHGAMDQDQVNSRTMREVEIRRGDASFFIQFSHNHIHISQQRMGRGESWRQQMLAPLLMEKLDAHDHRVLLLQMFPELPVILSASRHGLPVSEKPIDRVLTQRLFLGLSLGVVALSVRKVEYVKEIIDLQMDVFAPYVERLLLMLDNDDLFELNRYMNNRLGEGLIPEWFQRAYIACFRSDEQVIGLLNDASIYDYKELMKFVMDSTLIGHYFLSEHFVDSLEHLTKKHLDTGRVNAAAALLDVFVERQSPVNRAFFERVRRESNFQLLDRGRRLRVKASCRIKSSAYSRQERTRVRSVIRPRSSVVF